MKLPNDKEFKIILIEYLAILSVLSLNRHEKDSDMLKKAQEGLLMYIVESITSIYIVAMRDGYKDEEFVDFIKFFATHIENIKNSK
jgi:hypothetical protein